jgi:hypothetical protein
VGGLRVGLVAVLFGLLGARQLARGSLFGLPGGGLGGGLGGDGGLRARDRVLPTSVLDPRTFHKPGL